MPVYEFECENKECPVCQFKALYLWRDSDGVNVLDDPDLQECPECGGLAIHLYSLATMRPDTFWNGIYMESVGEYFTSESKYREHLKRNEFVQIGDRTDREGLTKWAREANRDKDKKKERELDKFLVEETKNEEWGITGTVGERNRKERKIREMESAHPEDVAIDPAFM